MPRGRSEEGLPPRARMLALTLALFVSALANVPTPFAQSLDKVAIEAKVLQLPTSRLPEGMTTYATRISGEVPIIRLAGKEMLGGAVRTYRRDAAGHLVTEDMRAAYTERFLKIHGLERVEREAELVLELRLAEPRFDNPSIKDDRVVLDGTNRTNYYIVFDFALPAEAIVRRGSDDAVYLRQQVGVAKKVEFTGEGTVLASPAMANEVFAARRADFALEVVSEELESVFLGALRWVNGEIGWLEWTKTIELFDVDSRREDYADCADALRLAKEGFAAHSEEPGGEKARALFRSAIEGWEAALAQADLDDRRARIDEKVARALQYNVGVLATWLGDYELARTRLGEAAERRQMRSEVGVIAQHLRNVEVREARHREAFAAPPLRAELEVKARRAADLAKGERFYNERASDWQIEGYRDEAETRSVVLWTRFANNGEDRASEGKLAFRMGMNAEGQREVFVCFAHRNRGWSDALEKVAELELRVPFVGDHRVAVEAHGGEICSTSSVPALFEDVVRGWNKGDLLLSASGGGLRFDAQSSLEGFPLALVAAGVLLGGETPADLATLESSPEYQQLVR